MEATATTRPIRVRKMDFAFKDEDVPRWWFYGNPVMTHIANGLNLLFPEGERFFIRSVKHYLDEIDDPQLRADIKGFFGQEGRHGHEHERANRMLEEQGLDLTKFYRFYNKVAFEWIEPHAPPALNLAVTAAAEHFTATMASKALSDGFMDGAHPLMAHLLRWHAAEEIEHKSVAFDVFQKVDGRYPVRIAGLFIAFGLLLGFWNVAARSLIEQEDLSEEELKEWAAHAQRIEKEFGRDRRELFSRILLDYMAPGFHPDQRDDYALARDYLEKSGAPV
ncbi:MAG: metal-dependent hydrolase [Sandaracinaceae bacterium]